MKTIRNTQTEKRKRSFFNRQLSMLLLLAAIVVACAGKGNRAQADDTGGDTKTALLSEPIPKVADADKKIPFERGSYIEESSTMGIEMQKTVYFDRWGEWTATEDKSEITVMGYTHQTHKIEIVKGKMHWEIDLIEKTGRRYELNLPTQGMAAALGAAIGGKMMEGMDIKELGDEKYLGYTCKKVQVKYSQMSMTATVLSFGNLTMKMEGDMAGMSISSMITSIDLSDPPASIFEVPEGVEIEVE